MKILIVDDEPELAELLTDALSSRYQTEYALNLEDAFRLVAGADLIVTDFHLDTDIKSGVTSEPLLALGKPTILLSGGLSESDALELLSRYPNVKVFLPKPYSLMKLLSLVSNFDKLQ